MPQIYYCDTEKFEPFYEECLLYLPEKRKEKAERFLHKKDKILSATAGLLLIRIFGKDVFERVSYNEHGKPFLEHGDYFSLSHSGRYSLLAVSKEAIGIDIESRDKVNSNLAKRCFSEAEQDFAKTSTEDFLQVWTAKEAVLKLLGTGFSYSPSNFSVIPFDEGHEINGYKMRFFCSKINEVPFTAAFCGTKTDFEIKEFLPEDLLL